MKNRWLSSITVPAGLLLLIVLLACSLFPTASPTPAPPPHYGAFLQKGDLAVEMEEYAGGPPSYDAEGIPTTSESQPLTILWHPDVNLSLLVLADEERGGQIDYHATPRDGGVLEIRPKEPLDRGVYCLVQGNPVLPPSLILHWCFYSGPRVAATPTPTAVTSMEESPVLPTTPQGPQPSEVGTGAVIGQFPENWEGEIVRLKLLALSEDFHPYKICGMDADEGFRLLLDQNRLVAEIEAQNHYRVDDVPAGTSLLLLKSITGYEDPSKPTGYAIDGITACGPFAIFPGQEIEIPWFSVCWARAGFPAEWRCPENLAEYPTTGPARIIGTYTASGASDHELALYALSSDFSPYELCRYEDQLEGISRSNELIQRISLTPGPSFSLEGIPSGRSLAWIETMGGTLWYFPMQALAFLPGQTLDVGELSGLGNVVDCTSRPPLDRQLHVLFSW